MKGPEIRIAVTEGTKYCPFLPSVPLPDGLNPNALNMYPTACIAQHCAIYEQCQGKQATPARFRVFASIMRAIASVPLLPGDIQAMLSGEADKLEAVAAPAQTPGVPTA